MMEMSEALLRSGLVTKEEVERSKLEKLRRPAAETGSKKKTRSDFYAQVGIGLALLNEVKSRPAEKIVCHVCGEDGYSVIETVVIHSELVDEWSRSKKGLLWLIDGTDWKEFAKELKKRIQEKFGNIIFRGGCWKCSGSGMTPLKPNSKENNL